MLLSLVIASASIQGGPFNYTGPFTNLATEGASWGVPAVGLDVSLSIPGQSGPPTEKEFEIRGRRWKSAAKVSLTNLKFSEGALTGSVQMANDSGVELQGVRFDLIGATESYKGLDASGKEAVLSRLLPVTQDSPILLGDLPLSHRTPSYGFAGRGFSWKKETVDITVKMRITGLSYLRTVLNNHGLSSLALDSKGRLLIGSGQEPGIYRFQPDTDDLELVTSTPFYRAKIAFDGKNKLIAAAMGEESYRYYRESGEEVPAPAFPESGGQPSWPRFDRNGQLYLVFWNKLKRLRGSEVDMSIDKIDGFELETSMGYDLDLDGTVVVGSGSNIFRFDPKDGKGKRIVQGPSEKLGRVMGKANFIRIDSAGQIWCCERTGNDFDTRIAVYDSQGRFLWIFGRGGLSAPGTGSDWLAGQLSAELTGLVFLPDGRVYASTWDQVNGVKEYSMF